MRTEFFRRLWWLSRNWKKAWRILQAGNQRRWHAEDIERALEKFDIPTRGVFDPLLAATNIGHALWLADQYGIQLHIGTCYRDCRAVLEKDKWEHPISPDANPWSYSTSFRRPAPKTEAIQGFSRWPEIAICQCVLNAKRAGVI